MKGETLIAEELNKGFDIEIEFAILSNIKKVALEKLKDENMSTKNRETWILLLLTTLIQT